MFLNLFIALGAAAFILMMASSRNGLDNDTRLVFTLFSFVLWMVWAFQAPSVRHVADGQTFTTGYTSLLVIGILFAALMALSFVMQAFDLFERNA